MQTSLWSIPGGQHDVDVGQAERIFVGHPGSVLVREGKWLSLPDRRYSHAGDPSYGWVGSTRGALWTGPIKSSGQSRTLAPQVVASGHMSDNFDICSNNDACLMGEFTREVRCLSIGNFEFGEVVCFGKRAGGAAQ